MVAAATKVILMCFLIDDSLRWWAKTELRQGTRVGVLPVRAIGTGSDDSFLIRGTGVHHPQPLTERLPAKRSRHRTVAPRPRSARRWLLSESCFVGWCHRSESLHG